MYCGLIYGVTRTTRGVPTESLVRFRGVPTDHMHGVTRTTKGVPTGPLARLGVYLHMTYMFMECVPAITRTTRGVPSGSLARLGVFIRSHSLSLVIPKDAHINLVIPKDAHISLVILNDTHINLVIPKDAHISLVISKDTHISLVIPKDTMTISCLVKRCDGRRFGMGKHGRTRLEDGDDARLRSEIAGGRRTSDRRKRTRDATSNAPSRGCRLPAETDLAGRRGNAGRRQLASSDNARREVWSVAADSLSGQERDDGEEELQHAAAVGGGVEEP
ncbi:hypothetical protein E5676_scaffold790G001120 [Cucumis melo var. makuwa]|uniref:NBS-LRR type resistance protein n=1 Tax=Cucumis melo var. makuwa TaxID=1194695 RepID=A0A5D3CVG5_CUCMM|nr:hypothetical protein E6C27_scaffold21G002020 [Cucumis melo var. makuwa]TYK15228.1 hypothetical protein E5676_scaffold790G001120 [Cucumis melo var. makuwa]